MNFTRLWYYLCALFCILNLKHLIDDSYAVKYLERDSIEPNISTNFWLCTAFSEIKVKSDRKRWFSKDNSSTNLITIRQLLNETINHLESKISFKFKLNESHLFNGYFCFVVREDDFDDRLDDYLSTFDIKLYAFSDNHLPLFYMNIYAKKSIHEFSNLYYHQQVFFENETRFLNCTVERNGQANTNLHCLKSCFGRRNGGETYFDFGEQDREVDLDLIFQKNNRNKELEKSCFLECRYDVCQWEAYNTISNEKSNKKLTKFQMIIETERLLLHFWLQFFGLITLFSSTSFVGSLCALSVHLFNRLDKEHEFSKYFFQFKFTLVTVGLLFIIDQSAHFIATYNQRLNYPAKTITYNFSAEPTNFSVVICIPVAFLISKPQQNVTESDEAILATRTFGEIEQLTNDGLYKVVDRIYLTYGSFKRALVLQSNKVYFRNRKTHLPNTTYTTSFQRCFRLDNIHLNLNLNKYQNMMTVASLQILFKNENYELHVIDSRLNFTSETDYQVSMLKISKRIQIKSSYSLRSNCETYFGNSDCNSQKGCIERCVNVLHMDRYSSIPAYGVIDKDHFRKPVDNAFDKRIDRKMTRNRPEFTINQIENSYFNLSIDATITKTCSDAFKNGDCITIFYYDTFKKGNSIGRLNKEIEFYFEKAIEIELEPSFQGGVVLMILNTESIVFGNSVSSILIALFSLLRSIFKFKWYNIYRYMILAICLLGFSIHFLVILNEIINGDLVDAGYFVRMEELRLPNLIFCFAFNPKSLDTNFEQTGNYLNAFTDHLTFQSIFDEIVYYNKHEFVKLNLSSINNSTKSGDQPDVQLQQFYFYDFKCFEIANRLFYEETDFYFQDDIYSLKLFLNERFRNETFYFSYRYSDTKQLVEIYRFNLADDVKYKIKLEQFEIQIEDKFELLKDPKRLIAKPNHINDANLYLKQIESDFKERYSLTTTSIPLEERDARFELTINNRLFEQYYRQVQSAIDDQQPSSLNSRRIIYNCYEQRFVSRANLKSSNTNATTDYDLHFGIDFPVRIFKITNHTNLNTLIQNILNSLGLWLNLCILEFHKCFAHIARLFKWIYKLLTIFRKFVKPNFQL